MKPLDCSLLLQAPLPPVPVPIEHLIRLARFEKSRPYRLAGTIALKLLMLFFIPTAAEQDDSGDSS